MNDLVSKALFADRYRLRKRLGKAHLWEVWLADNEMAGYEQVVKVFAPLGETGSRAFRREFARAYHLMHPRLLRATYFDIHDSRPYVVMPYCRRGSTLNLAGQLNEAELARVMKDVSSALAYIHQPAYNIAHQEIQPGNILLSDKGDYLLSDSGISTNLREAFHRYAAERDNALPDDAGMLPPAYRAPEYFRDDEKSQDSMAADIWALGATLFELAAGHPPFGQRGGEGQFSDKAIPDLPPPFSWSLSNILKHCLSKDPSARPSAENLAKMAADYIDKGQWPTRYFNDLRRGWSAKHWLRRRKPFFKRAALGVAFFTAVLAISYLLAWFGQGEEQVLTNHAIDTPDVHLLPAEPPAASITEKEPPLFELNEVTATMEEIATDNTSWEWQPESNRNGASANLAPAEPQPAAPLETKGAVVENEKTSTRQSSEPEQAIGTDTPKQPKEEARSKAPTESQPLVPKFNDLTGKWGYIDSKGTWIIWPQFEEAAPFENGKAKVAKQAGDGSLKFYYLDSRGGLRSITQKDSIANSGN